MTLFPQHERLLQIIWNERMLCAHPRCQDGTLLRVLSGGLWNRGSGPDFQGAALLLGERLVRGDIEIHRKSSDWFAHGHHRDPAYGKVILHAVWEDDMPGATGLPTLILEGQLLSSWQEFLASVEAAWYPHAREIPPGGCALRWALTDDQQLREILTAAGTTRFQRHGRRMLQRGMDIGLEQALYEKILDAMGYAANREAFRILAKELPVARLQSMSPDRDGLLAVFLGVSGLLPDPTREPVLPELRAWVTSAWGRWWQSGLERLDLPWKHNGVRPMNSVFRRVAGAALWLHQCQCRPLNWLEQCAKSPSPDALQKALMMPLADDAPWNHCRDFQHALPKPAALLGTDRRRDLLQNVLLPFLAAKAEMEGREELLLRIRQVWEALPRLQENHLMGNAICRFLTPPSRWRELLDGAAQQQGIMDIFQNFCLALDHNCDECPFSNRSESPDC